MKSFKDTAPKHLHDLISGAIFDFAGYLTTREESFPVGASEEVYPVLEAIEDWSETRDLSLDNPEIEHWEEELE